MAFSPEPASAQALQAVADAVLQAHGAANAALEAGARGAPRFRLPGLPEDLAPPPTRYRLATLELTVCGYALRRRTGWHEGEARFSLRRPPFWQRLRHGTEPVTCTLRADAGARDVVISYRSGHMVRPQLSAPVSRMARLRAWLSGWRRQKPSPEAHGQPLT